jgi:hypothetical protein
VHNARLVWFSWRNASTQREAPSVRCVDRANIAEAAGAGEGLSQIQANC